MDNDKVIVQWNEVQLSPTGYIVKNKIISRSVFEALTNVDIEGLVNKMTPKEELFAKFFSQAVTKATDLNMEGLVSWIDELEEIVFEAKAMLQGADSVKKARVAKLRIDEKDKIKTQDSNYGVSDAINSVAKRKDRMTKIDKLVEGMRHMGISEEDIKLAIGNISVNEDTQVAKNNLVTFNKRDTSKVDVDKVLASASAEIEAKKTSEPFDPTKLFG